MSLVPKYIKNLSPYVPGKRIEDIESHSCTSKIVKLSSNENPLGPSSKAIKAAQQVMKNVHRYPDSSGYELRCLLAEQYSVDIDNVILGNGSEGIMSTIIRTFLHGDDELISSENSFIGFRVLANASGYKVNWVSTDNYSYDLVSISNQINSETKIIYLANPDNPTGTYFTKSAFDKFIKKVPDRVLVILDEAYYEYAQHILDYPNSMIYRYDNVITLRTFSKCYGLAGFRVGYGFAHKTLIKNLMKVKLPFEPSLPGQAAALSALKDKNHLKKSLDENMNGMSLLSNAFVSLNLNKIPSVANFITLIFKDEYTANNFLEQVLKKGIILRGLKGFGLPCCVRVTIGSNNENKYFISILNDLRKNSLI